MKSLCVAAFLISYCVCCANEIDKLQTNEDVSAFLVKRINKQFAKYPLLFSAPRPEDTAAGRNHFFKLDIDGNHKTDLIIYGTQLLIILDKGGNHYEPRYLDRGPLHGDQALLIGFDTAAKPRKIIIQQSLFPERPHDTLVYLFGGFVEYNATPASMNVQKISLRTTGCKGQCPVFEISVDKERSGVFKAIRYNAQTGGFIGTLDNEDFGELLALILYLRISDIDDRYMANWTDDQTYTTTVWYDGKMKTITDYGGVGKFGLTLLYSKFFQLRESVQWVTAQ